MPQEEKLIKLKEKVEMIATKTAAGHKEGDVFLTHPNHVDHLVKAKKAIQKTEATK